MNKSRLNMLLISNVALVNRGAKMGEKKEHSFKVPAEIYYTDDGALSICIKFVANESSVLAKKLKDKVIDHNKSFFDMFTCREFNTLFQTYVMFSGMFQFTETPQRSKEEITAEALKLAVLRLLDKDDDLCAVCARRETCTKESEEQGEAYERPSCNVCVQHVANYYLEKAKSK